MKEILNEDLNVRNSKEDSMTQNVTKDSLDKSKDKQVKRLTIVPKIAT